MPKTKKNTYHTEWERLNVRKVLIKVNKQSEKEMADWLEEQPNMQRYIKGLIQADMERAKNQEPEG